MPMTMELAQQLLARLTTEGSKEQQALLNALTEDDDFNTIFNDVLERFAPSEEEEFDGSLIVDDLGTVGGEEESSEEEEFGEDATNESELAVSGVPSSGTSAVNDEFAQKLMADIAALESLEEEDVGAGDNLDVDNGACMFSEGAKKAAGVVAPVVPVTNLVPPAGDEVDEDVDNIIVRKSSTPSLTG